MKRIPVHSKGRIIWAKVDNQDYAKLKSHHWRGASIVNGNARAATLINGKSVMMHRMIIPCDGLEIDHKNWDTLDNRRANLRACTRAENQRNCPPCPNGTSRYRGVHKEKWAQRWPGRNIWKATISLGDKTINLGRFPTESAAALAYNEASRKYHGEFGRLNVVQI